MLLSLDIKEALGLSVFYIVLLSFLVLFYCNSCFAHLQFLYCKCAISVFADFRFQDSCVTDKTLRTRVLHCTSIVAGHHTKKAAP